MLQKDKKLLVTMALPYANGDIHLGHMVEAVQTDIFVRFQKLTGRDTLFVCADDTHGTPIQINAAKQGITPEELIANAWKNHNRDYKSFGIGFDIFYTTNSDENRGWANDIFKNMGNRGLVSEKVIEQYYCEKCARFLPDRYIKGTCPKCDTPAQYGDNCESCGTTYEPTELKEPLCSTCGSTPVLKESKHFFVNVKKVEPFLVDYLNNHGVLQDDMKNVIANWVEDGLREWCVSRDEPYFGFKIPETENKYFYVWLDAPIGYISSTEKLLADKYPNINIKDVWGKESDTDIVHFIGKDIVRFHTLFWPVMLDSSDLKLPSKIFVHGFLTVGGEKMSKSRGTFILAQDFAEKVKHPEAAQYLRFYYATKLSDTTSDLDLNVDEFCTKVNTTLVNNIGNFNNRTFVFLERFFDGKVPNADWDLEIENSIMNLVSEISDDMANVRFKLATEKIQQIGSLANKYYQDTKPWELIKSDMKKAKSVMVTCVNISKTLSVLLKPFIPEIIKKVESQFDMNFSWKDTKFSIRNRVIGKTEKLVSPIELSDVEILKGNDIKKNTDIKKTSTKPEITYDDFMKADLRVGVVKSAEKIKGSNKLLKLIIDEGGSERQIVGGLGKQYTTEEITGKSVIFVANMKPAKLMGELSEGMVLAAAKGKKMVLLRPDSDMPAGAKVS